MKFSQTQYIRFPTVQKLHFTGSQARKTLYGKFINPMTSRQSPQSKHLRNKGQIQQISEFKIVTIPQENCIMSIQTIQTGQKKIKKQQIYRQSTSQQQRSNINKIRSQSLTGLNFNIKKKIQKSNHLKPSSKPSIKLNLTQLYTQTINLLALTHRIILKKSTLNIRIRRARVQKGNNDLLIRQIIKGRSWWTTLNKITQQQGLVFKSINMNLVNLNWTQRMTNKVAEESFKSSIQAFCEINQIDKIDEVYNIDNIDKTDEIKQQKQKQKQKEPLYSFQRSFDKMLLQSPKLLQLFFTQWEQKPIKLYQWLQNLPVQNILIPQKLIIYNHLKNHQCITDKKNLYKTLTNYYDKTYKNVFDKIPKTYHLTAYNWQHIIHFIKKQIKDKNWLIKPGQNSNQGKGIHIIKSTKQLIDKILLHPPKSQDNTLIVQQYIKPMLYDSRKFDIRCYMLAVEVKNSIKFYWYDQGYIRTSSKKFTFNKSSKSIHLTNDAIQKKFSNYGQRESANKLSYSELHKQMLETHGIDFYTKVLPQMRSISRDLCQAAANQIGYRQGINFQIYGLDYLIDKQGKPWLIQVNTNPSYDLNCNLLTRIIPQMIQNAFRLILDVFLPNARGQPDYGQFFVNNNKFRLLHSLYRKQKDQKQK